jgi:hypothetical protein
MSNLTIDTIFPTPKSVLPTAIKRQFLPKMLRSHLEDLLDADLSTVQIYESMLVYKFGALAFTYGETICFCTTHGIQPLG